MNRRLHGALGLFILMTVVLATVGNLAWGQVPAATKSASSISSSESEALKAFIKTQVEKLSGQDAAAHSMARQTLINETLVSVPQRTPGSPSYLNAYAQHLNAELLALANNPSVNVRLNAAIVMAAVAEVADNSQLTPAAMAFINDKSQPVVHWALKASRYIIPSALRSLAGPDTKLLAAMNVAVAKNLEGVLGGAVATDAYEAMTLDLSDPLKRKRITAAMIAAVIPELHKLLTLRIQQYTRGVPPEPRAERFPASFLSDGMVWAALTPAQQLQSIQLLSDLLALAGTQAKTANDADRGELATMITRVASAISVAVDPGGAGPVGLALKAAAGLQKTSSREQITASVQPAFPALKAKFKDLKDPPPIQDTRPAPAPASAPTTGPVAIPGAGSGPAPAGGAGAAPPPPPSTGGTRPGTLPQPGAGPGIQPAR